MRTLFNFWNKHDMFYLKKKKQISKFLWEEIESVSNIFRNVGNRIFFLIDVSVNVRWFIKRYSFRPYFSLLFFLLTIFFNLFLPFNSLFLSASFLGFVYRQLFFLTHILSSSSQEIELYQYASIHHFSLFLFFLLFSTIKTQRKKVKRYHRKSDIIKMNALQIHILQYHFRSSHPTKSFYSTVMS